MTLEESLRSLATDDEAHVPHHVDAAVMAAWDASAGVAHVQPVQAGMLWYVWAIGATTLIAALGVALTWRSAGETETPSIAQQPPARSAPRMPAAEAPVAPVDRDAPVAKREVPAAEAIMPPDRRTGTAFVLVPEFDTGGPLTLMRVRMERRAFSRLGVPITNPDGDGLVDVDVLVGEDGVARSIRRAVAVGWTGPNP
jgi:hypothetical protein